MKREVNCQHPSCELPAAAAGWCNAHYQRMRHGKDMDTPVQYRNKGKTCSVDDCERPAVAKGLCHFHWQRNRKGIPLESPILQRNKGKFCVQNECSRTAIAKGLCQLHWRRKRKGNPMDAQGYNVGLTRKVLDTGYVQVRRRGHFGKQQARGAEWFLEHHFVLECHLGRPLRKGESVHHRNGKRDDNRLENLELWTSSQPAGQRVIDLLNWADRIIAQYEPELEKLGTG
ncbi:MAG: HNH endonuclease [Chloroflexota bacterium]|nr:HNH endonuclease [Chloroflexota bacterium]